MLAAIALVMLMPLPDLARNPPSSDLGRFPDVKTAEARCRALQHQYCMVHQQPNSPDRENALRQIEYARECWEALLAGQFFVRMPCFPGLLLATNHHRTYVMRIRSLFFLVLILVLGSTELLTAQTLDIQQKIETDLALKRLQGIWVPDLLLTAEGAEAYPLTGRALYFDAGTFARIEGKRSVASGSFKVERGYLRLTIKGP